MDQVKGLFELLAVAEKHLAEASKIIGEIEEKKILEDLTDRTESLVDEYERLDHNLRIKKLTLCKVLVGLSFLSGARTQFFAPKYYTFVSAKLVNVTTKGWGIHEGDDKLTIEEFFDVLRGDFDGFCKRVLDGLNDLLDKNLGRRTKDLRNINEIAHKLVDLTETKKS